MSNPKKILVTGCAGFIGSNFIKQFKKKWPKTKIIGLDNFSTGRQDALDPSIIFYEGSILDETLLEKIFSKHKPEYVFHFAALPRVSYSIEHPRHTSEVNIIGTIALLEAAKNHNVKRLIYSSSSSVYGGAKKLPTKESENFPDPKSPYAVQKYIGEPFCKIFSELFGLDTVCLRYFNVFGPGQYGNSPYSTVISAWLESSYFPNQKKAFIEGAGNQSRDFCYIDNVVRANILAMQSKNNFKGEVFNIAHGNQITINEVKKLIEKYTNKKLMLEKRPSRLGDVTRTCADISKAKKFLGYQPVVDFDEGLRRTVVWFESRKR
ncbi:MAG: NAD-dependent epimerase/dehydratase family protein [Candidatus Vogelbacteria bacterium]|nr:NAD-dependent epimerase/dehydratase family protein [Candidatus Vogelbacteria bacterium]